MKTFQTYFSIRDDGINTDEEEYQLETIVNFQEQTIHHELSECTKRKRIEIYEKSKLAKLEHFDSDRSNHLNHSNQMIVNEDCLWEILKFVDEKLICCQLTLVCKDWKNWILEVFKNRSMWRDRYFKELKIASEQALPIKEGCDYFGSLIKFLNSKRLNEKLTNNFISENPDTSHLVHIVNMESIDTSFSNVIKIISKFEIHIYSKFGNGDIFKIIGNISELSIQENYSTKYIELESIENGQPIQWLKLFDVSSESACEFNFEYFYNRISQLGFETLPKQTRVSHYRLLIAFPMSRISNELRNNLDFAVRYIRFR